MKLMPHMHKTISALFATFALIAVIAVGMGVNVYTRPGSLPNEAAVVIQRGSSLNEIARTLHENNIIEYPLVFSAMARLSGHGESLKAGEYSFPANVSLKRVVRIMISGKTVLRSLTVPEGLTTTQILELIKAAPVLSGNISVEPAEGELLPETYYYSYGDSRDSIIARMKQSMGKTMEGLWQARDPALLLKTPQEAITLASIVEKETGVAAERARVAGVFFNRLGKGIPLQADSTVIYAVTEGKEKLERPIYKRDLRLASPYNTYVYRGLTPGPIANPGKATLEAVLHPEKNDFIFFVADGSGGHVFAKTLAEHNQNVMKWRESNLGKTR